MKNGFTIIELIISIFILSVAIVGIFSAFSIMVILTSSAADRLTAIYLAQEGMEIIRNIRDTNWLNMDNPNSEDFSTWVDGLGINEDVPCEQGCEADYTTTGTSVNPLHQWGQTGDYLNLKNGFYVYDATNPLPTKFKRKIKISKISDYAIKIIVQVSWDQKADLLNPCSGDSCKADNCTASNCISAEGTLYDWYNYEQQ